MKLVHLAVVRELSSGVAKQMSYECGAASSVTGVEWRTVAWHDGAPSGDFVLQIPRFFRFVFLRQLFAWIQILKLSRHYDYVLVRHLTFDPFSFVFSPFINNRITIHHTKEVEEMRLVRSGWRGEMASRLEAASGRFALKNNAAIIGVTREIVAYEVERSGFVGPETIYPNGIDLDKVSLAEDGREKSRFNLAFMCSYFSDWHGLEKLFESVESISNTVFLARLSIHLIGELSDEQTQRIAGSEKLKQAFVCHGLLSQEEYQKVLELCNAGIGSMALELKGLNEACTLKVREMLAMGLPVISGHIDASLPDDFPFYKYVEGGVLDLEQAEALFGQQKYSRSEVRSAASAYIGKKSQMQFVVDYLSGLGAFK